MARASENVRSALVYHVVAAIKSNGADRIRPGDVIVLICQGPIGAGMPDDTRLWAALQRASGGTWQGNRI